MQSRSIATLDKIYAATEALIARNGIGDLTMEAVAIEAGISKGGVLHHFRKKESLVAAVALRRVKLSREAIDREIAAVANRPNKTLNGVIAFAAKQYAKEDSFSRALLFAAIENSSSFDEFTKEFGDILSEIREEAADPDAAVAHCFAALGILLMHTIGVVQMEAGGVQRVYQAIRHAAENF